MAWSPTVLLAGERVSFILDFSDPITNKRHHLLPYDFIIYQDGTEVLRKASLSQVGSDVQEVKLSKSGPINIRVENVGADKDSFTEFNSTVYENPKLSGMAQQQQQGQQQQQQQSSSLSTNPFKVNTLTLVWITYAIIGVIPAAVAIVYILYRKRII